jgi:hypothetical protein
MAGSSNQATSETTDWHEASMEKDNNSATREVIGANETFKAPPMLEKSVKFVFCVTNNEEATSGR